VLTYDWTKNGGQVMFPSLEPSLELLRQTTLHRAIEETDVSQQFFGELPHDFLRPRWIPFAKAITGVARHFTGIQSGGKAPCGLDCYRSF
jgi:hypothetical protein